jgi:hypothetical protein
MRINKEGSFRSPEGIHRAKIKSVNVMTDDRSEGGELLRIIFEIISEKNPFVTYMAKRNFSDMDSSEFAKLAYDLLGELAKQVISEEDGEINEQNLYLFEEKQCDIMLVHIPSKKHEFPFCKVPRITAPGKMLIWPPKEQKEPEKDKPEEGDSQQKAA